ncbi:MAG: NAD+ synthase [Deltaproteobacteria bacterium RIFOXYD12_FULL_53_23]|nr:MAG: NAD+ synthase [Deltaproteobacteria bacterium RIFOXYD12_FULL_53_23]
MKIALIQYNPRIGDFAANIASITGWLEKAKAAGCQLAVLPELALSGYPPQDLLERPAFLDDHDRAFIQLVAKAHEIGIGVVCGLVTRNPDPMGKPLHNSAVLFSEGEVLFTTHKQLLPSYDVFDEARYFEPGTDNGTFCYQGLHLGLTICEDIWNDKSLFARPLYATDPVPAMLAKAETPVDLLINIAASPFNIGKGAIRQKIFTNLCQRHHLPLIYVNQVGGQDSLIFDGDSVALDKHGVITAQAARFVEDMVVVDTDTWQGQIHHTPADAEQETAEVCEALVLGTRDYVRKCGFSKVVIGLSGGVDSALTAAIASLALGPENVLGMALPSPYSSPDSIEDAEQVARNLGLDFTILPITGLFETFLTSLAPIFAGAKPDVTEQNLQARIRGNLLMAIANKQGRLLLSTGNKSENAVGYCTLYGDMSGGLAVIADVPKQLVYALCRHLNRDGEVIPWRTIEKPPSAELAPNQKDEDDLPPYPVLDAILAAYLEEHRSIAEIVAMGFAQAIVEDVIRRILVNEYKRKQAPLGLKVTTKAFGLGRRYPTAEGYREGLRP